MSPVAEVSQPLPPHEQALLLDLDGLLLNTERPQRPVYQRIVSELFDVEVPASEFSWAHGASKAATVAGLNERFGKLPLLDTGVLASFHSVGELIVSRLREIRRTEMEQHGVELMPGALPLFDMADRGRLRRAVSTSRREDVARQMLDAACILPRVDSVVGEGTPGVLEVKPAPDIGQVSAQQLRVAIKNCWGLEDSPTGVRGQKEAGAKVLYVADLQVAGICPATRRLATHTVTSLEEAVTFLEKELGI